MELLYYLWVFQKTRWVQFRNGLRRLRLGTGVVVALTAFVVPIGSLLLVISTHDLTRAARGTDLAATLPEVPGGLLALVLLLSLFGGLTSALQSLFLATDLESVLVTPAPMSAVLLSRLLNGLGFPLAIAGFLAVAPLVGYGLALDYGLGYFVGLPLLVGLLVFLPTGLGTILALLLVRVVPTRFLRDFLNVLALVVGLGIFWLTRVTPEVGRRMMPLVGQVNNPVLPSTWAGQALVAIGEGRWAGALVPLVLVVGLSLGIFAGSLLLAERAFAAGVADLAAARGGRSGIGLRGAGAKVPSFWRGRAPRPIAAVILRKELRCYLRDTEYLQPLLYGLLAGGSWFWGALQGGDGGMFGGVPAVGNPLAALFIASLIAQHPGLSAIGREGSGWWQLQSAPIAGAEIAVGKLHFAYLPYLVIGLPYVLVTGLIARVDPLGLIVGIVAVALVGRGCAAILVNLGIHHPRLEWKTPSDQVPTLVYLFSLPLLGLYALPATLLLVAYRAGPQDARRLAILVVGLAGVAGVTWLLERWTLRAAEARLAAVE